MRKANNVWAAPLSPRCSTFGSLAFLLSFKVTFFALQICLQQANSDYVVEGVPPE